MNIKIRNLYQQSVLYTQQNAGRKGQRSVEMMCANKFAELIVRECSRLVDTRDARMEPAPHIYLLKEFGIK